MKYHLIRVYYWWNLVCECVGLDADRLVTIHGLSSVCTICQHTCIMWTIYTYMDCVECAYLNDSCEFVFRSRACINFHLLWRDIYFECIHLFYYVQSTYTRMTALELLYDLVWPQYTSKCARMKSVLSECSIHVFRAYVEAHVSIHIVYFHIALLVNVLILGIPAYRFCGYCVTLFVISIIHRSRKEMCVIVICIQTPIVHAETCSA